MAVGWRRLPGLEGDPQDAALIAFEELGMEAIREFEVENMPVTVAVDSTGESVHNTGPAEWRDKFPVAVG